VTTAGVCVYLRSNNTWSGAQASTLGSHSAGFIGVATSSSSSTGVVTRGIVYLATDPGGSTGDVVYLSTSSGTLSTTVVSATGNVNRVVGYKLSTNIIFFNPSQEWIVIS
jgi:hypothetical protein